jgi:SAM-dependent methyltransferase
MNYFAAPSAAERYANGRPFFHPQAIQKILAICCQNGRIDFALDVGCGTGQSSLALLEVADKIVGLDDSAEMLSCAASDPQISYVKGRAEELPFADKSFGLISVALAFHWFDQKQFMLEAKRVLRPGGWLVIYNDGFTGRMKCNDDFTKWNLEHYLVRYPTPPRNPQSPENNVDTSAYGFAAPSCDQFVHEIVFTPEQLVSYLLTQTNVIVAVEAGREDYPSVARWLRDCTRPLFAKPAETFLFSCQIHLLRRYP